MEKEEKRENLETILRKWAACHLKRLTVYYNPTEQRDNLVKDIYKIEDEIFILIDSEPEAHYYVFEINTKSPIMAKLTEQYRWLQKQGVKGITCGYYCDGEGVLKPVYDFPKGTFILHHRFISEDEDYCLWNYVSKEEEPKEEPKNPNQA
ncbi:MAG: hypothetical protein KKA62_04750 [Nanoarchaeota archaeon]|nr:hypothetical protein [Nanoarchaeota archaeon]MBU1644250.1 hypothetical protein [Nanoarchaeota archaeon]MBU1977230.1 hypothetical protein [Nanoarchaeota archaeon]